MALSLTGVTLVLNAPAASAAPRVECSKNIKNTWGAGKCTNWGPGRISAQHIFDCSWQADLRSGWDNIPAGTWVKHEQECRFSMRDITAQLK
ncbi:hypothetical protein Shyd_86070 [Streptomyces hydrogenans]|uniref:Uncharacterized protein n=1 Tax=Streptomyces hydrogenans TaxID=1873719 RepID=A0ABQ3PQE0_9ACTN|nr:hypothetical protein Shyd_86070 [Streptomyces hydrogenans]